MLSIHPYWFIFLPEHSWWLYSQFPKLSFHEEMVLTRTRQLPPWCCRMWHEILWLMGHHGESRDRNIERRYNSEEHCSSAIFVEFQLIWECAWTRRDCAYLVYLIAFLESGSLGFTRFVNDSVRLLGTCSVFDTSAQGVGIQHLAHFFEVYTSESARK